MPKPQAPKRWRPTRTNLIAGGLVIAGFLLTEVNWWFFLLAAAGTFGPGILRELGWLRDKDEFQRQAAHRAGYHAFLVVGLVAFVLVAFFRSGGTMEHPHRLATFFLALLWFTWFLSSLMAYWGPHKTAVRILITFGSVWLVFAIISNLGPEWTGWPALLLTPLLAAPFFVLAWLSGRWPRIAGVMLLAVSVFLFVLIELPTRGRTSIAPVGSLFITTRARHRRESRLNSLRKLGLAMSTGSDRKRPIGRATRARCHPKVARSRFGLTTGLVFPNWNHSKLLVNTRASASLLRPVFRNCVLAHTEGIAATIVVCPDISSDCCSPSPGPPRMISGGRSSSSRPRTRCCERACPRRSSG